MLAQFWEIKRSKRPPHSQVFVNMLHVCLVKISDLNVRENKTNTWNVFEAILMLICQQESKNMEAHMAWAPEGLWQGCGVNRNVLSRLLAEAAVCPWFPAPSCEITEGDSTCHFCPFSPFAQAGDPVQLETNLEK